MTEFVWIIRHDTVIECLVKEQSRQPDGALAMLVSIPGQTYHQWVEGGLTAFQSREEAIHAAIRNLERDKIKIKEAQNNPDIHWPNLDVHIEWVGEKLSKLKDELSRIKSG